jgi:hypothetical protein
MPGDPKHCREQAKCCLELAANSTSPLAKARFEDLADKWMRLATELDRTKLLLDGLEGELPETA